MDESHSRASTSARKRISQTVSGMPLSTIGKYEASIEPPSLLGKEAVVFFFEGPCLVMTETIDCLIRQLGYQIRSDCTR